MGATYTRQSSSTIVDGATTKQHILMMNLINL